MNMTELIKHVRNTNGKIRRKHGINEYVITVYFDNSGDACTFKLITGFDGTIVDKAVFAKLESNTLPWE